MKYLFCFFLHFILINFSIEQNKNYCDLEQKCNNCTICGQDSNNYCSCNFYNIYCRNDYNYTILTDFIYSYDACIVNNRNFENICGSSNVNIDIGITKNISIQNSNNKNFFCFYNVKKIRNNNNDINIFLINEGNKYVNFNLHLMIYYNNDKIKVSSWMNLLPSNFLHIVESNAEKISVYVDIPDGAYIQDLKISFSMENARIKKITYETKSNKNKILIFGIILGVLVIALIILTIFVIRKYCHNKNISQNLDSNESKNKKISILEQTNQNKEKMNAMFKTELIPSTFYKNSIINDNYKCTICLEEFKDGLSSIITTKCKHSFHEKCFKNWVFKNILFPKCPNCNNPILDLENNNQFSTINFSSLYTQTQ